MNTHKFKIIGIFALVIVLTLTLSSCDLFEDDEVEPTMYELTVKMEGEGVIYEDDKELLTEEDSETIDAEENTSVTLKAEPDEDWEFIEWTGAVEEDEK